LTARTAAWFASVVSFGLILIAISGIGLTRPVENASFKLFSPLEAVLRSIASPIADAVTNYSDVRALTEENDRLRSETERLNAEIARLREDGTQREQLERLLAVKNGLADQQLSAAKILARDPSNLRQAVAIDKGRADGLKKGMPVLTEGNALVGTVTKVEDDHAWITLVTDVDSGVSALILESRAQGVVSGAYNRRMVMDFVSQDSAVRQGDTVITSGVGGSFPPGLVIGRVTGVGGERQDIFRSVTVEPLASLSKLETVIVMTSFVPKKVTQP
jgi:rod shape-determining protein MreC